MLNRGAVIVRPKQPYLAWATGLDDSGVVPDVRGEKMIYLIPSFESDQQAWEILEKIYDQIFNNELRDWHTDPSAWPQDRSFAVFQHWFHVEFHSVVEDLCDYEIVDEDGE
ncbi:MAG: hypothetical protein ACREV3_08330 [Gammaproteobacteria bacterium]